MATYNTERRTKEVGIRKVFGAGNFHVTLLLSTSFLKILLISIFIGAPLSYFLNNLWLRNFPNKVDFGLGTLVLASVALLALGIFTVGSQAFLAAHKKPVETLKSE